MALCAGNSPVTGEFPSQRPVTRSFVDLHLNERLSKQSWGWWSETPSCSLWRHCYGIALHFLMVRVNVSINFMQYECCSNVMDPCAAHYYDVIMGAIASQITSPTIVYSTVYLDADQSKHQSSASLAFVREIHRGPVNFPHKWPVTRKMSPFDDVIMN